MFSNKLVSALRIHRSCLCGLKILNKRFSSQNEENSEKNIKKVPLGEFGTKYQVFRDQDAEIILDVYEERLKYSHLLETEDSDDLDPFVGLNLERGKNGVFEIEDLVEVLKVENGFDIFVASIPKEIKYVDYIAVVSGKSQKHMQAIAQFVRKVYKQKRHKSDIVPKLEGAESKDWMAMDLGNIALHIFAKDARKIYDLDSLWAVGPKFDNETNKRNEISEMLEKHSIYLADLVPAH